MRLQAALAEQGEMTVAQKRQLEQIQQEKILCRICFDRDISLVLLPCRHRVLCRSAPPLALFVPSLVSSIPPSHYLPSSPPHSTVCVQTSASNAPSAEGESLRSSLSLTAD